MSKVILYSYRRCPYAMRARMALRVADIEIEQIEISLRDKPQAMLDISPKGTVPVLQCPDGRVIEQSLEIMRWALERNDPQKWLQHADDAEQLSFVQRNDTDFKHWLDRYKYAERYPDFTAQYYRDQAIATLLDSLEARLAHTQYLGGQSPCLSDVAIFPFVRQFAAVDATWFGVSHLSALRNWLRGWVESELFVSVMAKPVKPV
ncbi:MAG: glutathione S-transferase [Betaproteobacteria bacterium]